MLIAAVSFELVFDALRLARRTGFPAMGFFAGALTFFVSDMLIARTEASERKSIEAIHESNLVASLVLAIILDGVAESIAIGLGTFEGGTIPKTGGPHLSAAAEDSDASE